MFRSTLIHLLLPVVDAVRHVFAVDAAYGIKKCVQALPVLLNLRGHMRYVRLINQPHALPLTAKYPRLAYKWLGHSLSLDYSASKRLRISFSHYQFLRETTGNEFLGHLFEKPRELWSAGIGGRRFSVAMAFPRPDDQEGDLSLTLHKDDLLLCTASFVFCRGEILGLPNDATVLLIARIQGAGGRFDRVRSATHLCQDIAPADLLMSAVLGVVEAFGIRAIVGVSTNGQVSRNLKSDSPPFFDYDGFWLAHGSARLADGSHRIPVPYPEKPIESIKSNHRSRTRRKREFKRELSDSVRGSCRDFMAPDKIH